MAAAHVEGFQSSLSGLRISFEPVGTRVSMSTMRVFFFSGSVQVVLLPPAKYSSVETRYPGYVGSIRIEPKRATVVSQRVGFLVAVVVVMFDLRSGQTHSSIELQYAYLYGDFITSLCTTDFS